MAGYPQDSDHTPASTADTAAHSARTSGPSTADTAARSARTSAEPDTADTAGPETSGVLARSGGMMRSACMQSLTNDLRLEYPGVVIYGKGDPPHQLRISDHNEDDTVGSLAAQTDADTVPEHRAIDVMLGPAFTRIQAMALILWLLSRPELLAKLRYINFENTQWHMRNNWEPRPNYDDPHPTHIHFSGLAAKDEDASPWLGAMRMRSATVYRRMSNGACLLRDGGRNYGITTIDELAAIQRLIKAAGGDSELRNVNDDDWQVLLKSGTVPPAYDVNELAAAIAGHIKIV